MCQARRPSRLIRALPPATEFRGRASPPAQALATLSLQRLLDRIVFLPRYSANVTVRETECDRLPDVPITETVATVGPELDTGVEAPFPHPVSATKERVQASKIGSPIPRRRMRIPTIAAIASNGTRGDPPGCAFMRAALDEVPIVRVDEPGPVTFAGANVQVEPAGSPEHENETTPLNALIPLVVTVV